MTKGLDDQWSDQVIPDDHVLVRIGLVDSKFQMVIVELFEPEDEPFVSNTDANKNPYIEWNLVR